MTRRRHQVPGAPEGVARVYPIEEAGPLVRLSGLVDLDDLTLWLASLDQYGDPRYWDDEYGDEPTRLYWQTRFDGRGIAVRWFRLNPCPPAACGDHGWHVDYARVDTEAGPTQPMRGVFLGVWE